MNEENNSLIIGFITIVIILYVKRHLTFLKYNYCSQIHIN